jgi:hypothetical protein
VTILCKFKEINFLARPSVLSYITSQATSPSPARDGSSSRDYPKPWMVGAEGNFALDSISRFVDAALLLWRCLLLEAPLIRQHVASFLPSFLPSSFHFPQSISRFSFILPLLRECEVDSLNPLIRRHSRST